MRYKDSILAIEITNNCNLKCPMCTQSITEVPKGYMDITVWKNTIDDLSKNNEIYETFLPFGIGEPLLHPEFANMLEYALKKNKEKQYFRYIIIHTNAILLNKKNSLVLLSYSPNVAAIHLSLDAISQETYSKVRPGGTLSIAIENIKEFIKLRKEKNLRLPNLIFQFIIMKQNQNQARLFLDYWSTYLKENMLDIQINYDWFPPMEKDTIFFKRENTWNPKELKKAEELHKNIVAELGLIDKETKGRILDSDEYL